MKLSESNHVVWGGEFLAFVLKTAVLMFVVLLTTLVVDRTEAQSIFGRIAGTVTDSQGGVVAGAKITIINEETKLERQTATDSNGYYVASDLPVGIYSVISERSGFKTVKKTGNDLVAGARMSVDLSLWVGEVSQRREVAIKSSNFSAEYGRNSGASINVVTRSGGDSYHGTVFEFIRNEKLDAKNPAPGALKTPLRFNDFGWDFGGPIKRGKLFFFAGEEWKRIRLTATPQSRTVPLAAELTGDFSALLTLPTPAQLHEPGKPGTPIPGNRLDLDPNAPLTTDGKAIAKIYSTMTALASGLAPATTPTVLTATFQPNNPFNWRQDLVRLDYRFNDKHSLYGRYLHDNV